MSNNWIKPNITLSQVYADLEKQEAEHKHLGGPPAMIFYSTYTLWWTHRAEDLQLDGIPPTPKNHPKYEELEALRKIANRGQIPKDRTGSVLYQTENWRGWLDAAKEKPEHFGMFGLTAFMAMHHRNHELFQNRRPYCPSKWPPVGQILAQEFAIQNIKPEAFL